MLGVGVVRDEVLPLKEAKAGHTLGGAGKMDA